MWGGKALATGFWPVTPRWPYSSTGRVSPGGRRSKSNSTFGIFGKRKRDASVVNNASATVTGAGICPLETCGSTNIKESAMVNTPATDRDAQRHDL